MTEGRTPVKHGPPQHLYDGFNTITSCPLLSENILTEETIREFEYLLNQAQPKNANEESVRSVIQYMYWKNPINFCRFLLRSKLSHLILWTDAKCIIRHFQLRGLVYVKWNEETNSYNCALYRNRRRTDTGYTEHSSMQRVCNQVGNNDSGNRTQYYSNGHGTQGRGYDQRREKTKTKTKTQTRVPKVKLVLKKNIPNMDPNDFPELSAQVPDPLNSTQQVNPVGVTHGAYEALLSVDTESEPETNGQVDLNASVVMDNKSYSSACLTE